MRTGQGIFPGYMQAGLTRLSTPVSWIKCFLQLGSFDKSCWKYHDLLDTGVSALITGVFLDIQYPVWRIRHLPSASLSYFFPNAEINGLMQVYLSVSDWTEKINMNTQPSAFFSEHRML
jgi:hypothetical protein